MAPKRRASSPLSGSGSDTDDLVSRILAPNPKHKKKRARREAKEETKASLKIAKQETNFGLKAKMKGKGGSRTVSQARSSLSSGASGSSRRVSSSFVLGRIVLLPDGFNDKGEVNKGRYSEAVLQRHSLVISCDDSGQPFHIDNNTNRESLDKLLRKYFPAYFTWRAKQGEAEGLPWKLVAKSRRKLEVAYDDSMPMLPHDIRNFVINGNGSWARRALTFTTDIQVPDEVFQSWGPQAGGRSEARRATSILAKGKQRAEAGSGSETEEATDLSSELSEGSDWAEEKPLSQVHRGKLRREPEMDFMNTSLSSIHLDEPTASSVAGGSGSSSTSASAQMGSAANPIEVQSSSEDLKADQPAAARSTTPVATGSNFPMLRSQPKVTIKKDSLPDCPWD